VFHNSPRWLAVAALALGMIAGACGSSGATASPAPTPKSGTATAATAATSATAAPIATVSTTIASASCPTAAKVGAALGITLSKPVSVTVGGANPLPAGAKGVSCDYAGTALNVLIELITNISPSYIDNFSSKYPVPYVSVSGVGDQARSFFQTLGGGKDNEGVVATKGQTLVAITATATPASLAQIEALINQLL
jgi:hypothetical protein